MKKLRSVLALVLLCMAVSGCSESLSTKIPQGFTQQEQQEAPESTVSSDTLAQGQSHTLANDQQQTGTVTDLSDIPDYSGDPYITVNNNVPFFKDSELSTKSYETYSDLDQLGRCGVCIASIGQDLMPTEDRGNIGSVKPTGWHTVKYDCVDGKYLYNRCHLIGYQLTAENANTQNLITGTRYLNVDGMLPFENMVADYVKETANHVLYRVTPVFDGNNLVADGVLMEAESVEDHGDGVLFNVFCYNVQPGISIDYATGESSETGSSENPEASQGSEATSDSTTRSYAVNKDNGKIHIVGECAATGDGKSAMKDPVYFDTLKQAVKYSKRVAPDLEKRKCGNCW